MYFSIQYLLGKFSKKTKKKKNRKRRRKTAGRRNFKTARECLCDTGLAFMTIRMILVNNSLEKNIIEAWRGYHPDSQLDCPCSHKSSLHTSPIGI